MARCLPTCARGFSFSDPELVEKGVFFGFLASPWYLVHLGELALPVIPLVCTRLGSQRCALCLARPVGGGQWEHSLCYRWGVFWAARKTACQICERIGNIHGFKLYMLALVGRPSLHSYDACMFFLGPKGHSGEIAGRNKVRPFFS